MAVKGMREAWWRGVITRQKDWDEPQWERDLRRPAGSMRHDRMEEDGCYWTQQPYRRGTMPGKRRVR